MFRRVLKPLATTTVFVALPTAYIYHRYTSSSRPQTFGVPVREAGPDGEPMKVTRSFNLLPMDVVNARIAEHATLNTNPASEGMTWKYTTAHLSSNDPIEDANAEAIISKISNISGTPNQLMFFAVMDGHAGVHTSRLLSKVLLPAVSLELAKLVQESSSSKSPVLEYIKSLFSLRSTVLNQESPTEPAPEAISLAIQKAFTSLDFEIVNGPLRILAANAGQGLKGKGVVPDLSQHPMALASMLPALSGSCAIMAMVDPALDDLYVACTGDSRAVAGIWEEAEDGTGLWRVEILSQDQTGRNPNELKRIQSEHPPNEADDVVRRGRILGGLEPSRAFGDARYKWPRQVQEVLNQAFLVGNGKPMRNTPPLLKTPPYVTATPVIIHRKLGLHPTLEPVRTSRSSLRFLVLATDGLWDELSSEEVVALVGGYLAGVKGIIPKSSLPGLVSTISGSLGVEGKEKRRERRDGSWAFVDDNASAHLIRNAFGGGDEDRLRKMLSIPAPHSRRYRDDVTVTVVWWEADAGTSARAKL